MILCVDRSKFLSHHSRRWRAAGRLTPSARHLLSGYAAAPSDTKETRNENLKLNPDNDLDEAVQQVLEVEVVPDGLVVALDRVRILGARLPIAPVVPQQEAGQQRVAADHR